MSKQMKMSENTERVLRALVDSRWNTIGPSHCPTCGAPQPDYEIKGGVIVCSHCHTKLTMVPTRRSEDDSEALLKYDKENPLNEKNAKAYMVIGFIFLAMTAIFVAVFIKDTSIAIGIIIAIFGWITISCFKNGAAIAKVNETKRKK